MKRWIKRILAGIVVLVLIVAAVGYGLFAGSEAKLDGHVRVKGLSAPVVIARDHLGVATITADNRTDLAYALGFEHAQERFFQMDLQRRMAAGELAALVGPAALKLDLDHRRHRFRERDRALIANLPPEQHALLVAYRDGVNAGLEKLRVRPWEYLLLRAKPKPWRIEDTFLTVDAMFLDLNRNGDDLREMDIERLRKALPRPVADLLMARSPRWEAPLQGDPSPAPVLPDANVFTLRNAAPAPTGSAAMVGPDAAFPGSNNFAVAGSLTGSGAIVANDMHLSLRVPNIWFRAQLRYKNDVGAPVVLNGLTLPGTPMLIDGSNGHIAWAFTNSYGDWQDWVRVDLDPKNPNRYRTPDGWATIQDHQETIQVKGETARTLTVRETRWGPIMGKDLDGTPLALSWIAHLPRTHNLNLLKLEQIDTVHEALLVAPTIGMPPQNFVVGDAAGHIGWTVTGNALPLRSGFDPLVPADWSVQGTGWIGFASPLQFPRIEDPVDGRLWTANNRTTSGDWLALLGDGGFDRGARAQQIRDDLNARNRFTTESMLAIQLDDRAVFLTRWQQLLQDVLQRHDEVHLDALQQLTAHWQGRASIGSVDYRLVRAFREQVVERVLAPFVARVRKKYPDFKLPMHSEATVWAMIQQRPMNLLDPRYADWDALLLDAAQAVNQDLGSRPGGLAAQTWGARNTAAIQHPLARVLPSFLARRLSMPAQPLPGDHDMPRVQTPDFGASERFGIMPGHEARSYLHMPGGQSDHPLSPFFGAGHEAWVHGRPTPLLPGPVEYSLTLEPAGSGS
ncbi:penicillin acylase family protein [Oleiagrimonas soli]|uniref:Penicillin amidase n=1 Tax=Oleiagrimonas soli TaxID=1543381 RepID=A0A099CXQ9_9GAMM|nr:penicillin acylase family protein [Oleiagrimonas soli]KGI77830.1 peptidase S45 [Oleiagrimonas soli]MBB6183830.1 penicillin amidase [Oleiagrimonas soli]